MKKEIRKMTFLKFSIAVLFVPVFFACTRHRPQINDVVIENEEMRLVISSDGMAKSLFHKPSGEECLMQDVKIPAISMWIEISQSPFHDFFKTNMILMGEHEFLVDSVYMEDNKLIAHFDMMNIDALINVEINPQYLRFSLEGFRYNKMVEFRNEYVPENYRLWFCRLPVRNRTHFGNWLNIMWDQQVAVNLLGTNPHTLIVSEEREGYRIMKAGCISEVDEKGASACLITSSSDKIFDNIEKVEEDFGLPHGVRNRRREQSNLSSYWSQDVNPKNVDKHIKYALQGGFRTFYIYYPAFSNAPGHFEWSKEYPNGIDDLRLVVEKIEKAGLIPGVHIHYNKAGIKDKYVSPVPDPRLHHSHYFTLAAPLGINDTTIYIEENPHKATLADGRCILRIGNELISYKSYTTRQPYKFTGCIRGILNTDIGASKSGLNFGLIDVDGWPVFVRIDQNTGIQEEVAERLAGIYQEAGFKFVYFDGAEDVHAPYWFTTSNAQWEVYKRLKPEPIFAGAAAMSHYSWHMLSRGNHFDSHFWLPEDMKNHIKTFLGPEAPLMAKNFTSASFGRYQYFAPGENSVGLQPDMLEYLSSKAAAWDSPWVIKAFLDAFEAHPRTSDNLEVIKRWEEVKAQGWLSREQKEMLKNWEQEYILLENEQQEFELLPYKQINNVAGGSVEVRAFLFERENGLYAVYWHATDNKKLELLLNREDILLYEDIGNEVQISLDTEGKVLLPLNKRHYIKTSKLSREELIHSFQNARILD